LKTNKLQYTIPLGLLLFLIACSTKKDNFATRNFQALNTKYNVLYNGGVALDKGIVDLKSQYKDNFWEILPIERQQPKPTEAQPEPPKNANFERAETKSTKAIQRRSINIDGTERNPQIDEAYLMLGKSRYYDQRFIPALEAFNYILYKYPKSDKINVAKIWREKTNIRLDNDALAITNLSALLKEIKFKDQVFADANAILAQAFLKEEKKDSAETKLRTAIKFTKQDEEKSRYRFILGQIQESLGQKDSAFATYQSVIDMNRKSARQYVIHAHARQASQFDFEKGDTIAFLKKFNKLLNDRENRPFLDVLNHQMGLFYDKSKNIVQAKKYYNKSLKAKSADPYLEASNFRNLADIYFYSSKYVTAGKYFDSTMTKLNPRSREFKFIKKKRENLDDVIKYETIAQHNDSILKLVSLSESEKTKYFEDYITKLKKDEEKQKEQEAKAKAKKAENKDELSKDDDPSEANPEATTTSKKKSVAPKPTSFAVTENIPSNFYFYNPTTVAYGKVEFKKNWGERVHGENWRNSELASKSEPEKEDVTKENLDPKAPIAVGSKYTTEYYLNQIPKTKPEIDLLIKDRNFAYYQLGVIYKEKFKENKLAESKFESLLMNNPEERLVLPSMYNLFKLYEISDKSKAEQMRLDIIKMFPDSRYAQILSNTSKEDDTNVTPEIAYDNLYKQYLSGDYRSVLKKAQSAIEQYTGEDIVSKFELLKANTTGKIKGLAEFKKALNFVALTYPNSKEGKDSEAFLAKDIPAMENLQFNEATPKSWKVVYKVANIEDKNIKKLQETITKFIKDRTSNVLTTSLDLYTMDENFIVIHGIKTQDGAKGVVSVLKEFKEYKVSETAYVLSNENYKIIQIKKNLDEYLLDPNSVPVKRAPVVAPEKPKVPESKANSENKKQNPRLKTDQSMTPPSRPGAPPSPDQIEEIKQNEGEPQKR
jgi:TolA-binding protein